MNTNWIETGMESVVSSGVWFLGIASRSAGGLDAASPMILKVRLGVETLRSARGARSRRRLARTARRQNREAVAADTLESLQLTGCSAVASKD